MTFAENPFVVTLVCTFETKVCFVVTFNNLYYRKLVDSQQYLAYLCQISQFFLLRSRNICAFLWNMLRVAIALLC